MKQCVCWWLSRSEYCHSPLGTVQSSRPSPTQRHGRDVRLCASLVYDQCVYDSQRELHIFQELPSIASVGLMTRSDTPAHCLDCIS